MTQAKISDSEIIKYLKDNPDFFIRNHDLLQDIKVSETDGKITSLANHHVNNLKQQNNKLQTKLAQLITHATENEKIVSQVFELSLQICQISQVANITKHFSKFVNKSFKTDLFKIVIPEYDSVESSKSVLCVHDESDFFNIFKDFMQSNTALCGRLKKDMLEFVFDKKANNIGSSVMLPIGVNAKNGILVFASYDENRFIPDMSTDILSKLTDMLEIKFKNSFNSASELNSNQG